MSDRHQRHVRALRPAYLQYGATMIEFAIVGPIITFIGLGVLQYAMLFNAKSLMNHAAFMAARAGSMGNARVGTVQQAYIKALIPLYGGGGSERELQEAYAKASADTAGNMRVQILNPKKESFDDWSVNTLEKKYGARAIPNSGLPFRDSRIVGPSSGQNIHDANLLKIRILHGYLPKIPLIGKLYASLLKALDTGGDAFYTAQLNAGRIPVVTDVTVHMQSDPVEGQIASVAVHDGTDASARKDIPSAERPASSDCGAAGCAAPAVPPFIPDGGGARTPGNGCPALTTITSSSVPADVLFEFDKAVLTAAGKASLNEAIAEAKTDDGIASVTLTGNTDQLGDTRHNIGLSLSRAAAVRDYLLANGFPAVPIHVRGMGSADLKVQLSDCPADGQARIDCLAPNRRVDIAITRRPG